MTLFGCAFEDFLTRERNDGRTIVDDYLKRRGWKEPVPARRYMEALRDSDLSLYEVSEVVPGQSFLARDLLRGGDPVQVVEHTATRSMATWERLATRIVSLNGKHVMSGGTLVFNHALADQALRELRRIMRGLGQGLKEAAAADPGVPAGAKQRRAMAGDMVASLAAPLLTGLWLEDALNRALGRKRPPLVNSEGDALELHTVRYPLLPEATVDALRERLDAVPSLRREDKGWDWIEGGPKSDALRPGADPDAPEGAFRSVTFTQDGEVVTGRVKLDTDAVVLSVNARARAEQGRALLSAALVGLTRAPLTQIETVDQALATRENNPAPASSIPPETEARIVGEFLENHYRGLLDQPIPALGDMTPREAAPPGGAEEDRGVAEVPRTWERPREGRGECGWGVRFHLDVDGAGRGGSAALAREPFERREVSGWHAGCVQGVFHGARVRVADGHAADHDVLVRQAQRGAHGVGEVGEGRLRAGVQPQAPRGDHDVLQEHAVVEPTADLQPSVDGEDHADGGVEEAEVAGVLALHLVGVAAADAEQGVEAPAHLAPTREIGFEECLGVVAVVAFFLLSGEERSFHFIAEPQQPVAGQHVGTPGLHVGAAGRAGGDVEQMLHRRARYRRGQECPQRSPRGDCCIHRRTFVRHIQGPHSSPFNGTAATCLAVGPGSTPSAPSGPASGRPKGRLRVACNSRG
jgi:hypothetical protein